MFITLQKGFCEYLGPTSGRAQLPRTAALLVLTKYWSGIDKFEHIRLVQVIEGFFSYPADIGTGYSFKTFIPVFGAILGLQLNFG